MITVDCVLQNRDLGDYPYRRRVKVNIYAMTKGRPRANDVTGEIVHWPTRFISPCMYMDPSNVNSSKRSTLAHFGLVSVRHSEN